MLANNIERAWINSPSALQSRHCYHGLRVLFCDDPASGVGMVRCWPVSGAVVSMIVPVSCLSLGWPGASGDAPCDL